MTENEIRKLLFYEENSGGFYGAQQGWICPRCGRANAPWMPQCTCNPIEYKVTCKSMEE